MEINWKKMEINREKNGNKAEKMEINGKNGNEWKKLK